MNENSVVLSDDATTVEETPGRNSFLQACDGGNTGIVKFLAEKNPKLINSVDENNDNGLHLAALQGNMDIVELCVEKLNMDPTADGSMGQNSFLKACDGGSTEVVKFLAEKNPKLINSVDDKNDNGLHLAALQGNMDVVELCVENLKMDPAAEGFMEQNSFLRACDGGNTEIVKFLAEKDPDLVNSVDEKNDNGLHLAARNDKMDTFVFLTEELIMDTKEENQNCLKKLNKNVENEVRKEPNEYKVLDKCDYIGILARLEAFTNNKNIPNFLRDFLRTNNKKFKFKAVQSRAKVNIDSVRHTYTCSSKRKNPEQVPHEYKDRSIQKESEWVSLWEEILQGASFVDDFRDGSIWIVAAMHTVPEA